MLPPIVGAVGAIWVIIWHCTLCLQGSTQKVHVHGNPGRHCQQTWGGDGAQEEGRGGADGESIFSFEMQAYLFHHQQAWLSWSALHSGGCQVQIQMVKMGLQLKIIDDKECRDGWWSWTPILWPTVKQCLMYGGKPYPPQRCLRPMRSAVPAEALPVSPGTDCVQTASCPGTALSSAGLWNQCEHCLPGTVGGWPGHRGIGHLCPSQQSAREHGSAVV